MDVISYVVLHPVSISTLLMLSLMTLLFVVVAIMNSQRMIRINCNDIESIESKLRERENIITYNII